MCRLGGVALIVGAAALILNGCVYSSQSQSTVRRFSVAADEPRAALIGRQILAEGGNAVDAAVATALAMTVTLPSRVGLAGGGACLVHDPEADEVRVVDFLPRPAADAPGGRAAAVPGLLRGLAALHSEYGTARWQALVTPAESLARFGHPVSRALARDIAPAFSVLAGDPATRELLTAASGEAVAEGDMLVQPELAAALGQIRADGVGAFYSGPLGRSYAEAATAAGYPLSVEAIRAFRPEWRAPLALPVGNDMLYFAPDDAVFGPQQALVWRMLTDARSYGRAPADERLHLLVEAQRRALAAPPGTIVDAAAARRLMEGYDPAGATAAAAPAGATTFGATLSILAEDESAVTCGFTTGGLFGAGHLADGTGLFVVPVSSPGVHALGGLALAVNHPTSRIVFAGSGADVMAALTQPLAEILLRRAGVEPALAEPRAAPDFTSPEVLIDGAAPPETAAALTRRGHVLRPVPAVGRATAVWCDWDRAAAVRTCHAAVDPRGHGLATAVQLGS